MQYTEQCPTLTSDKRLRWSAAHKNYTYFLTHFQKQVIS